MMHESIDRKITNRAIEDNEKATSSGGFRTSGTGPANDAKRSVRDDVRARSRAFPEFLYGKQATRPFENTPAAPAGVDILKEKPGTHR